MICGYSVDDLLVVAEVMKKNPAIMDSLKHGYIKGFKDGYNAAVKDFDEAILEHVRGTKIFTQGFQEFIAPKNSFDVQFDAPPVQPCESREEIYARIYTEKVILPGEIVAIKKNEEGK
jgi:hypothetical protein